jgi:hypothetical protein
MTVTLKEQHRISCLRRLNESSQVVTARALREHRAHVLIIEALDGEKFAEAAAVLKKLQGIDFGRMKYFKHAVQQAMGDVNDALGGSASADAFSSGLGKIMNAAQQKLSAVVRNPIPNTLAFVSAMEQAFEQAETLIQGSFSGDLMKGLKSGKIPQEKVLALTPRKLVGEKARSLENALTQAFAPEGILAKLGLTWKKRYLDPEKAANAIMDAPLSDVIKAAKSFKQGPQMTTVAQNLDVAHELEADSASQEQPAQEKQPKIDKAPREMDPDDRDELVSKISGTTNVGSKDVEKVIDLLLKRGLIVSRK